MFSTFERTVAWRYLRAKRREGFISVISWFSLLGIALGVATLIIVMAVMNGFRAELFSRILGLNGHLNIYAQRGFLYPEPMFTDALAKIPGVKGITPLVEGQVLTSSKEAATGAVVRGIKPADIKVKPVLSKKVVQGSLDAFQGDGVAIGVRMAQRLGVKVGGKITLVSPRGMQTAFGTVPRIQAFPIAAIYDVGMFEFDNNFVFMPIETAQNFFGMGQGNTAGITMLEMMVADPNKMNDVYDAVIKTADDTSKQPLRLLSWRDVHASFVNALQVERNVMFLILTLIILVAAFNIISGMIMLVKDKGRDIAILRTMGATRGSVMRIFFLSGASIGVVGTLAGVALGVGFSLNIENIRQALQSLTGTELFSPEIYFLSQLPAKLDMGEVVQVVIMALGLSFLATLYPSWRAARLDPVEALRYE
ncbi:MAG: lipoprotein-releasing ABC transporter permease subunit [Alphaproteobacteria bacterium]|nr:lipoprotein-releasing ABC transporter permease subunit [Alphaproteobacteria bacterium]